MTTCEVAACPACGADDYETLGATDNGDPSLRYELRRCRACSLYFKSHRVDDRTLAGFYGTFDVSVHDQAAHIYPPEELMRAHLATLPEGSRVLDYGCCTGRFLTPFTTRFECHGIEPHPAGAATARERGVQIIDDARLSGDFAGFFDAILLNDVYEHLTAPTDTLARLAGALKPGGSLLIATGVADAIPRDRHMAGFWYLQIPWHVLMLSRTHAAWLADRLGLTLAGFALCSHFQTDAVENWKLRARQWAYRQFHDYPPGEREGMKTLLRLTPRLRAAEGWKALPAVLLPDDHALMTLTRPQPTVSALPPEA